MNLRNFCSEISDVLFPPLCLSCERVISGIPSAVFCPDCLTQIPFFTGGRCPVCGIVFPDSPSGDHWCSACLEQKPAFASARAAVAYEGVMLSAIHAFKYGRNLPTGKALAQFLADHNFDDMDWNDFDIILPVPLHIKRLRERGFNQSLILARALGKTHGLSVNFSLLKRRKFTLTQTGLDKHQRQKNVKGAFAVLHPERLAGKKLILVDDVYTTGATLNECAKVLLRAQAACVRVITLARVLKD